MTATTDLSWLTALGGRCPRCYLHMVEQGHRSTLNNEPTGCPDEGPLADLLEAQRLRDRGMARTVSAHPDDAARVDAAIAAACKSGRVFSANDFRHLVNEVEQPNVIGARIRAAAQAKRIRHVGYVPSNLPSTHAHDIKTWEAA